MTVRSLNAIAAKHGFTLETLRSRNATTYVFRKGDITVKYHRQGYGSVLVTWCEWLVLDWLSSFEVDGKRFSTTLSSREEYVDALLPRVTESLVVSMVKAQLDRAVKRAREELHEAENEREDFRTMRSLRKASRAKRARYLFAEALAPQWADGWFYRDEKYDEPDAEDCFRMRVTRWLEEIDEQEYAKDWQRAVTHALAGEVDDLRSLVAELTKEWK